MDKYNESSDEDYVPDDDDVTNAVFPSEEESDGENEQDEEEITKDKKRSNRKVRTKKQKKIKLDEKKKIEEACVDDNGEEQKRKADSLWASFLKDDPKPTSTCSSESKATVTKVVEFAGEKIEVKQAVPIGGAGGGRGGRSSLSSALTKLGKKEKLSTLEKSKLDWDRFKAEENIEEELTAHNKGKDGYLEKQDFLQRADLRRFEIEKDIRTRQRSHRL